MSKNVNKTEISQKENCTNFDADLCEHMQCSECGMNPEAIKQVYEEIQTLESKSMRIIPMKEINQEVKGKLIDIIPSPFTDSDNYHEGDEFFKFEDENKAIFYVNKTADLKQITKELVGKILSIKLIAIEKIKGGSKNFKRFLVRLHKVSEIK